jgi:hypothetical protein
MEEKVLDYHASPSQHAGVSRLDLAVVAIRVLAIYAALEVIAVISWFPLVWRQSGPGISVPLHVFVSGIPMALLIAAAVVLWVYAERIAARLLPPQTVTYELLSLTSMNLQALALSIVGAYLVVTSGPHVIGLLAAAAYDKTFRGMLLNENTLSTVLQFPLGVVLFLQGKGLARVWHRLRSQDNSRPSANSDVHR